MSIEFVETSILSRGVSCSSQLVGTAIVFEATDNYGEIEGISHPLIGDPRGIGLLCALARV